MKLFNHILHLCGLPRLQLKVRQGEGRWRAFSFGTDLVITMSGSKFGAGFSAMCGTMCGEVMTSWLVAPLKMLANFVAYLRTFYMTQAGRAAMKGD